MPAATIPVIVQSDRSVLLEVHNPLYEEVRDTLAIFAELEKSPEYIHTYRITPLSLWNAASSGVSVAEVLKGLEDYSKFPLPDSVRTEIQQLMGRYGLVWQKKGWSPYLSRDLRLLTRRIFLLRSGPKG